jgi:hypothetical protein
MCTLIGMSARIGVASKINLRAAVTLDSWRNEADIG